jgi:hypothetical protein
MIVFPRRGRLEASSNSLGEFAKIQRELKLYGAASIYHSVTAGSRFGNYLDYGGYRLSAPAALPGGRLCRLIDRPRQMAATDNTLRLAVGQAT